MLAWAFFPVVLLIVHAAHAHAEFTGADGLIGADGVLGADQLQYLAWAREIADHGLAADLFTLGPSGHVYVEPVVGILGGLVRLGVPLVTGYLALKACTVVVVALGLSAWVRRFVPHGLSAALAAAVLATFLVLPATSLVDWLHAAPKVDRFDVFLAGDELLLATKLWGYLPSALALGLLPLALLGLERATRTGRSGAALAAAAAALLVSWLHPWQGITLVMLVIALAAWRRRPAEWRPMLAVLLAAGLPLVYYAALAHWDPAWHMAARNEQGAGLPLGVLLASLGPIVAIAALGATRPRGELAEQALLLWIPAALLTYFVDHSFPTHALQGISIPFAILAVRAGRRIRLPSVLGVVCVGLLTVPGLVFDARKFVTTAGNGLVQYELPEPDATALRWVDRRAPTGGVLAPTPFAAVVPEETDRAVWVGHGKWSPHYPRRAAAVDRLFDGHLRPASAARAFVASTGARILVADCRHRADLARDLGPMLASVHRFGCARVYVLRPASRR